MLENPELNVNKTEIYSLRRVSFFKNGFKFETSENLVDMTAMLIIFSTNDHQQVDKYNKWNFPSGPVFDEFWFDEKSTQYLFHSVNYKIGKEQIDIARIRATPEIRIHKQMTPNLVILGIPLTFVDKE